jgi:sialate O-acetylesterase
MAIHGSCLPMTDDARFLPLLHPIFSDGAVLQRGRPVSIWGWAEAGSRVIVSLKDVVGIRETATASAAFDGRWHATLGPLAIGGPYELTAVSGDRSVVVKGLLVGDVYLCSGQSNMVWSLGKCGIYDHDIAMADFPQVRQFSYPGVIANQPQVTLRHAKWTVCTPLTAGEFSAVGFFLARQLTLNLGVPIGIINCAQDGTSIDAWMSDRAVERFARYANQLADWRRLVAECDRQFEVTGKPYAALMHEWYERHDSGTHDGLCWFDKDLSTDGWTSIHVPCNLRSTGLLPNDWQGTCWLRREVHVPQEGAGKSGCLNFASLYECNTVWINGHLIGESEDLRHVKYPVPSNLLAAGRNTIAIRLLGKHRVPGFRLGVGVDGRPEECELIVGGTTRIGLAGDWLARPGVSVHDATPPPKRWDQWASPTSLFNGMVAPLAPATLAGIFWYQGEANIKNGYQYRSLLPALVADWRTLFGQGDIPFFIISLPRWGEGTNPGQSLIAELREAQIMAARSLPNTHVINTIDLGDPKDVHPCAKAEFGIRAALAAQVQIHGLQATWQGPCYASMQIEGDAIRVFFDRAEDGLKVKDGHCLTGFVIAGEDRVFVPAQARIDKSTVVVKSNAVLKPQAVRYAWEDSPSATLLGSGDLVAWPFRSDDWPIFSQHHHI